MQEHAGAYQDNAAPAGLRAPAPAGIRPGRAAALDPSRKSPESAA